MTCNQCGTEIPKGGYFCGSCGRPVGYGEPKPATLVEEVGLEDVPNPEPSQERPEPREPGMKRALCGICLGAFPVEELSTVDGQCYCPDCSPVRAHHAQPEPGLRQESPADLPPIKTVRLGPAYGGEPRAAGRGKLVLVFLLLAAVAVGGYLAYKKLNEDRVDKLLSGVDDDRTDARYLISKYRAGETLRYGLKNQILLTGELGSVVGGELWMKMDVSMGMDMETLSVDEDGNGDLRILFRDAKLDLDMKVGGEPVNKAEFGGMPRQADFAILVRMDPFGTPLGDIEFEGQGELLGGMSGLTDMLKNTVAEVPRRHLQVGDTWHATLAMPMRGGELTQMIVGGTPKCKVTYTVEGFKEVRGRDCMAVSIKGDLENTKLNIGVSGVSLDGHFKGVMFHDCDAGVMVNSVMDVHIELSGTRSMKSMKLKVEGKMDLTLESSPGGS